MALELLPEGATKDTLTCSDPTIPSDDSNLVIKVRDPWFCTDILQNKINILTEAGRCCRPLTLHAMVTHTCNVRLPALHEKAPQTCAGLV